MERSSVIIIPALDPGPELEDYIRSLAESGFEEIILVDDGSSEENQGVFQRAACVPKTNVHVLRHVKNYGKGRALKDAFNFFLDIFGGDESILGAITVDSDGQHLVSDVIRMDEAMKNDPDRDKKLYLGVRDFNSGDVPPKSKFGNRLTRGLFRILYGRKVTDTQTGLRGIPKKVMWHFLDMPGERFEYETGMLIRCVRRKILFQELEIRTVYIENNRGSHFRAFRDSLSVYRVLFGYFFKFCLSSLSAAALDLIVFQLTLMCIASLEIRGEVWIATAFARLCSSLYNYFVNQRVVFKTSGGRRELLRYYMLSVAVFVCSAGLVDVARGYIKAVPVVILKAVIDACLFLVSYQIQQRFVFTARTKKEK